MTGADDAGDAHVDCNRALAELYQYLDGHLTEVRRTTISAHLDLCSPCLSAFTFETELRRVVSTRCSDQVPDELRLRIAEVIRTEITVIDDAGPAVPPADA